MSGSHSILKLLGEQPRLADYLVFGQIRWSKGLGLPEGKITDAFHVECFNYQDVFTNPVTGGLEYKLKVPHHVQLSEGVHDDAFYRVDIGTTSSHTGPNNNVLEVSFRAGLRWPVTPFRTGTLLITPDVLEFKASRQVQILPDIQVVNGLPRRFLFNP
jgi:hypothetical protein